MLPAEGDASIGRGAALAQAAAFTLLNPHVYLDTVLLVGGIGAQQPARYARLVCGGGQHRQCAVVCGAGLWRPLPGTLGLPSKGLAGAGRVDRPDHVGVDDSAGAARTCLKATCFSKGFSQQIDTYQQQGICTRLPCCQQENLTTEKRQAFGD